MNCREFKSNHVGFVDDLLSAFEMAEMRSHLRVCPECAELDVRIRRSLLVVRNLPQIEASPDFYLRLSERLHSAPSPVHVQRRSSTAAAVITAAALAAAIYFAIAGRPASPKAPTTPTYAAATPATTPPGVHPERSEGPFAPSAEPTLATAVPTGVPVWPAMFMVADLPAHLTTVDLVENSIGR